jgi:hypothetical protein
MGKKDFSKIRRHLGKPRTRWHNYWVLRLKPYRVLNKDGGIFQYMENARCCFFRPQRSCLRRRTKPVGGCENVPWRLGRIVRHGNFRLRMFAGLLMARSAKVKCKRAGGKNENMPAMRSVPDPVASLKEGSKSSAILFPLLA